MHPALEFTIEIEKNDCLPFLDVQITKANNSFNTSVFRKKTFTGLYQRWDSFCPMSMKLNLIDMLVHRAVKICSKSQLTDELEKVRSILVGNGYPLEVIEKNINLKLKKYECAPTLGPRKCPVYLKLPYLGDTSEKVSKVIRSNVEEVYNSVKVRIIYSTRSCFPASRKDAIPILSISNVIYQYKCKNCDCSYIGRTTKRLYDRICEHVPRCIRQPSQVPNETSYCLRTRNKKSNNPYEIPTYAKSAIGDHLIENPDCATKFTLNDFTILSRARTNFHLNVLEAILINKSKPLLCRQKQYVYNTKLFPFSLE